jgi:glyoxylase-like metal-dependent hydrolase (beta-lactamase superfamily II)
MKSVYKFSLLTAVALLGSAVLVAQQRAQQPPQAAQQIRTPKQTRIPMNADFAKLETQTLKVQGNVHLVAGAGANVTVQAGDDGILLVDTGFEQMNAKTLASVRKISEKPIRTIINTTLADDHTGANGQFVKAGFLNQAGPGLGGRPNEADLIGHNNLLRLMTEIGEAKISTDRWPPSTYPGKQKDMYMNDEPVVIMHIANATTSGDSMVWFRKSDVVVTGDIFDETSFPFIDLAHGGNVNGIIEGLNTLLEITVPKHLQEGGTMVVPGHGRIGDEHDVLEYRDMVTIVRNRVQNAIKKGMSLQQIKAAKPSYTYEYEPRFNRNPAWTAEMFVEAIYKNLSTPSK